jgi:organic hydroperoxide reductase OsmC/OhrA
MRRGGHPTDGRLVLLSLTDEGEELMRRVFPQFNEEEAFVASISSCHMLTFLWFAGRAGFQADSYRDEAVGTMTKNERGVPWVSRVTLRPQIKWSGEKLPAAADLERLHHQAHEGCFIAASVKTEIVVADPVEGA